MKLLDGSHCGLGYRLGDGLWESLGGKGRLREGDR